jgi:hypothetical protein
VLARAWRFKSSPGHHFCGRYRYWLTRTWEAGRPSIAFIGLNPSTADAHRDDPTLRRCLGFARSWGCGRLIMLNLFAFRATNPAELRAVADPVGAANNRILLRRARAADRVIAAWGNGGTLHGRAAYVTARLDTLACLGVTAAGQPRHPLYVPAATLPMALPRPLR